MKEINSVTFLQLWRSKIADINSEMIFIGLEITDIKLILLKGNCTDRVIVLKDCTIPNMHFEGLQNVKAITIQNCLVGSISFNKCNTSEIVEITSNDIDFLEINEGIIKHIAIHNDNKIKKLKCGIGKWDICNIFTSLLLGRLIEIEDIQMVFFATECNARIYLSNVNASRVEFRGVNLDSRLVIQDCLVEVLYLHEFRNECDLSLSKITPRSDNSSFAIYSCDLGKTTFENVDFAKFRFVIMQSSLSEIKYYNVNWAANINSTASHWTAREAYRQLKIAAEKQGDRVQALTFERNEIEHYRKELKTIKGNWGDKFILYTNLISNNHGQNWFRALLWTLVVVVVFHSLIQIRLLGLNEAVICYQDNFPKAFLLLNPVHDARIISSEIYDSFSATFIDFLSRIVIGYLIFQLIRAFRKYTRA